MIKAFLLQLQFLTRIPLPFKLDFNEKEFARGIIFAPVIGLIIGLVSGGIYYLFYLITGKSLPAIIFAVIAEILITGGLHLDGLADTFDGVFSNRSRERILEIMKDSRIGTTGALALIMLIICKIGILLSIDASLLVPCFIIMPVISRMNIVWACGIFPNARKDGMANSLTDNTGIKDIIIATVLAGAISVIFLKFKVMIVLPASVLIGIIFLLYIKKKIGGITGDIIGALIELTELIVLFAILIIEAVL
jgi:adenosylcobinamide-GDP ribazoletransferase